MTRSWAFLLVAWSWLPVAGADAIEFPFTRTQRAQKLVEEGQEHILRGDYFRAIDSCTRALGLRGDWAPAFLCRGEARLRLKDPAADGDARQAMRLDPKNGEPYRILGILEFEEGKYPSAIQQFDQALRYPKLKPDALPDVYYYRAKSRLQLGDAQSALKDVDRGLGIQQGINGDFADWSFYELRAEIYRRLGDADKAAREERRVINLIDQRLRRRPYEAPELLRRRAESNALLKDYDHALQDYGEILKISTGDVRVLLDRAEVYSRAGKSAAAIADLNQILKISPRHPQALRQRAVELFRRNDYRGAVRDLDAYLDIQPNDPDALADRGISKRYLGDFEGAIEDIETAQMLEPSEKGSLWGPRAYVLEMLERHEEALDAADKALKEDPNDYSVHVTRAQAGWGTGRCARVSNSLDWLVEKSSWSADARSMRGECRCATGDAEGCFLDLEQAAQLEPRSKHHILTLALHHRIHLNHNPRAATAQELRRSIRYFDRAKALGALNTDQRLGRLLSLHELAEKLTAPADGDEKRFLQRETETECRQISRRNRKNGTARDICSKLLRNQRRTTPSKRPKIR